MTMIDSPTPYRLGVVGLDSLNAFTNPIMPSDRYHHLCPSFFEPVLVHVLDWIPPNGYNHDYNITSLYQRIYVYS